MQTSKAFFAKIQGWGTKVTWQNYYDWWDLVALLWSQKTKRGFCIWEHLGSPAPKKAMVPKSKENFLLISTRWLLVYSCCNLWSDSECVIRFSGQYFTLAMEKKCDYINKNGILIFNHRKKLVSPYRKKYIMHSVLDTCLIFGKLEVIVHSNILTVICRNNVRQI